MLTAYSHSSFVLLSKSNAFLETLILSLVFASERISPTVLAINYSAVTTTYDVGGGAVGAGLMGSVWLLKMKVAQLRLVHEHVLSFANSIAIISFRGTFVAGQLPRCLG